MNPIFSLSIVLLFLNLSLNAQTKKEQTKYLPLEEAFERNKQLLAKRPFYAFPELRENSIKWHDSIPQGKIVDYETGSEFHLQAQPGEFFTYQLGLWALKEEVQDVYVYFSPLKNKTGQAIPSNRMTCFNKGGIDFEGHPFSKQINVPANRVQPLWIGIDLDEIENGIYSGIVTIISGNENQEINLSLNIEGEVAINHGYNNGDKMSRLNWLNSTKGIDNKITNDFQPVSRKHNEITILGRRLNIAQNGLPSSITTFFGESNQSLLENGSPIINEPFRFIIEKENGDLIKLTPSEIVFTEQSQSRVAWQVINKSEECNLECTGKMEFDGFVDYQLKLTAKTSLKIKDIRLEIPVQNDKAKYMMGLGHEGGLRTPDWKWTWDVSKNQDMLWVGTVNGGIRIKWKAENYVRPLVNIYYGFGPLNLPASWGNAGKGGVEVIQKNDAVAVNAFSGARNMVSGDVLNYNFELLITPFKVIDNLKKYGDRYFHGSGSVASSKVEKAKAIGANVINIHHNEDLYPFINYPYQDAYKDNISKIVEEAHQENLRMKLYYTTRELTNNLPEFWAMNSLNGEVIFPGPGNLSRTEALHPNGPDKWLVKNMREKYIPAWYNEIREGEFKGEIDLSVITTPDSRLNNFYIAGLEWMIQKMKIDGIYIDDSALDRFTLQRARKIIDNNRPNGRIDLHSWNHFNDWAGYTNCLNLYMDLLPYIDLVWIGEGRDYNRMSDHWLIEVSGIPFGIPGQMLHGDNPWRGMVYGITNRGGYSHLSPEYLWQFFDEHNIENKEMIGYWDSHCPVKCNNTMLRASVFKGKDEIIISVANWSNDDIKTSIDIDWIGLGIDPKKAIISLPGIEEFQEEQLNVSFNEMIIPGSKGYLIVIKN